MFKNVFFFPASLIILSLILVFFTHEYLDMMRYTRLMNKGNIVYASYQNLSRQIKNAAVLTPSLIKAGNSEKINALF